jgi:hypothetical protein
VACGRGVLPAITHLLLEFVHWLYPLDHRLALFATVEKNELKPWLKKQGCIPPQENAEFVCAMEEVLEVYTRSYDETHPLICMDESCKQQVEEVRAPLSVKPGEPEKYDSEYQRNGVSHQPF